MLGVSRFWAKGPDHNPKEIMSIHKQPLRPERLRQVPAQFSWLDHRLVREGHLRRCTPEGLALYLFLVTVADAQGLSYYGDATLAGYLAMEPATLQAARRALMQADLIAYERPLYQVLSLDPATQPAALPRSGAGEAQSIAQILASMGVQS
jgi:hypothetical protein